MRHAIRYGGAVFFAVTLFAAAPAAAQQQHQQSHPGGGGHPAMHAPQPAMRAAPMRSERPAVHMHVAPEHRTVHHTIHGMPAHRTVRHVSHHAVHHAVHTAVRTGHRAPKAVVARLRRNVVAVHRFHAGPYRGPRGWHYRRWVFGERLPAIYFTPTFWITDFLAFDLFAPPDGYVWVRYGPDALLIDEYSGDIVQVQYGVFY